VRTLIDAWHLRAHTASPSVQLGAPPSSAHAAALRTHQPADMSCEPIPLACSELRSAPWSVCATRALHQLGGPVTSMASVPRCAALLSRAPRTGTWPQQSSRSGAQPVASNPACARAARVSARPQRSSRRAASPPGPRRHARCAHRLGIRRHALAHALGGAAGVAPRAAAADRRAAQQLRAGRREVRGAHRRHRAQRERQVGRPVRLHADERACAADPGPRQARGRPAAGAPRRRAAQRRLLAGRAAAHRSSPASGPPCQSRAC